jgi:hypothetical protein
LRFQPLPYSDFLELMVVISKPSQHNCDYCGIQKKKIHYVHKVCQNLDSFT